MYKKRKIEKSQLLDDKFRNISFDNLDFYNDKIYNSFQPQHIVKNYFLQNDLSTLKQVFQAKQVSKYDFVEMLLKLTKVDPIDIIPLTWGCIKLFEGICLEYNRTDNINFTDFLDYLIKQNDEMEFDKMKIKEYIDMGGPRKRRPNKAKDDKDIRVYEKEQPLIYINMNVENFYTNGKSFKALIKICLYIDSLQKFVIITEEANKISFYSYKCEFLFNIQPKKCKEGSNIPINSVVYSEEDKRVR